MNTWNTDNTGLASSYTEHIDATTRGAVRQTLVTRALLKHLPASELQILDVGGGAGHQAIALARAGHRVVLLDSDEDMLARAGEAIACESYRVSRRIDRVHGSAENLANRVGYGFDAVLSHGVLLYVDDPFTTVANMLEVAREDAIISILTKNGNSLAMRPGMEGRWDDALNVLDQPNEVNRLGAVTRADTLDTINALFARCGASLEAWYGVQLFADYHGDEPPGSDFQRICELEWEVGCRDPYRQVARLFHVIGRPWR